MGKKEIRKAELAASFKSGAIALAFMVIGYQSALLVGRASVLRIVANRDAPDTVFVAAGAGTGQTGEIRPPETRRLSEHRDAASRIYAAKAPRRYESFRFNPNTVGIQDLMRLGFSEKQAVAIDNYRKSGGRFRRREDFAKSFVVADSVYRRLEAFLDIPPLDINKADSAEFDTLPGIGPYFASQMVRMREELGGYSCCEQLMEIHNFGRERYEGLSDLVVCSPPPSGFRLWTLPEDSLRLHPYIRDRHTAHAIVLYRGSVPSPELTVESMLRAGAINEETARKLSLCRIQEP